MVEQTNIGSESRQREGLAQRCPYGDGSDFVSVRGARLTIETLKPFGGCNGGQPVIKDGMGIWIEHQAQLGTGTDRRNPTVSRKPSLRMVHGL